MSSISFQDVKSTLQNNFMSLGCSPAAVNQLLTDDFVNGIITICEQNQNQYNGEILACVENLNNSPNLSTGKIFHDTFYIEAKKDGIVKDIIEYLNKNINISLSETPTPALLSLQNLNENTSTLNTGDDITIGKGAIVVLGALSIMALVAGGPAGFATFMLATVYVGGIFFEFDENGNLRYKEADYLKDIDNYMSTATTTRSPLIVDLDGDGVETTTTEDGTHFDHDNNGFAEKTSWVGKDDGLLVRDINGNGQIDDGTELFGNNSILSNGQKAVNGFEALKDLDSNNNGIFDSSDTAWNQVNIWKDSNQNGKIDEGELLTLEQAEIESIDLDYQNSNTVDINGNTIGQTGSFDKENGTQGSISDIWFNTDLMDTVDKTNIDIPADIAALPNVSGFGNVHDLHTAMALDSSGELKALVQQYVAETDSEARQQILYNIIYHWTGVQDEPIDGRDPTQVYGKVIDDTRKLEALEEFMGEEYLGTWCWGERDPNPHGPAAPYILRAFDILAEYVNNELLAQTHYKLLLENVTLTWNAGTQNWDIDVSKTVALLGEMYQSSAEKGFLTFYEFSTLLQKQNLSDELLDDVNKAFKAAGNPDGSDFDALLCQFGEIVVTEGDDVINGDDNNNIYFGLGGNDVIYGGAGNDTLDGGAGNDNIFGEDGNDILIGNEGNDYLIGGNGADTYVFNPGFGNDAIDNSDDNASANEPDIIQFGEGILASKTTLGRQGFDLIITISYDPDEEGNTRPNDSIRVYSYFDQQGTSSATVNSIVFADGTNWDYEYVIGHWNSIPGVNGGETLEGNNEDNTINGTSYNDILIGNGGNDIINAGDGNDRLLGGTGSDTLNGGSGDDTYLWNWGDGMDTISDTGNHDKISFGDSITYSDLKFRQEGGNLRITVKNNENQGLLLNSFFSGLSYKIEDLYFQDGSIVHLSEIPLILHQLNTDETINLTGNGDTVYANGGDDRVNGGQGNDTIFGGDGNDNIYGNSGNDVISGGKGDDSIDGGNGVDTYIWNLGDGLDTIAQVSSEDIIKFGSGITFDNLSFRNDNGDLRIYINGDDTQGVICKNFFGNDSYKSKQIIFNDGTSFALPTSPLTLIQKNTSETVTATIYDDTIYANGGNDTVSAGNGDDTIYGGQGFDTLKGENGNDTLIGGTGNDYLNGGEGNDTYIYNIGDGLDTIYDYERNSNKNNKIKFGEGISSNDLTYTRKEDDLIITLFNDITQGIIIQDFFNSSYYQIENLEFADGSIVPLSGTGFTLIQTDANDDITGTGYADTIYGNGGNDTIAGGYGDDTLVGGKGNDRLEGERGNDTYVWNLGDGFDTISDYNSSSIDTDTIKFGEGIALDDLTFSRDGYNFHIYINGDKTQGINIQNQFYNNNYRIEKLEFADGTIVETSSIGAYTDMSGAFVGQTIDGTGANDTLLGSHRDDEINGNNGDDIIYGNNGNDTIAGGYGNDTLIGGKGDDHLEGERGNDTYVWNLGDGFDTISDYNSSSIDTDTIKFGEGIALDDLTFSRDGYNFHIYVNGDKTQGINIQNQFYNNNYRIEKLEFADGTVVETSSIGAYTDMSDSLSGQNIDGTDTSDTLIGGEVADEINGNNGDDIIYGNNGNDTIAGGYGDDTLIGGKGDDHLEGERGNDTYVWNLGDGFDTISDYNSSSIDTDTIKFGEGITLDDLTFSRDGYNFHIYVNGDKTQGINIQNQFYNNNYRIEKLEFADGTIVETSSIGAYTDMSDSLSGQTIDGTDTSDTLIGGEVADEINGNNDDDIIYGNNGNDTIAGGSGNDTLIGGKGDDRLEGSYGNDTYVWNLGDGFDTIYDYNSSSIDTDIIKFGEGITLDNLTFSRDGYNFHIYINGDKTQGINIQNQFYNNNYRIEKLEFADGTVIETSSIGAYTDMSGALVRQTIEGTDASDTLIGGKVADEINGNNGNDTIYGNSGNDTIDGGYGNDTLIGGKGNDRLEGSYGNDTYVWNLGDGFDTIYDYNNGYADTDTIKFGEGITLEDLTFSRAGDNFHIYVNGDKTQGINIQNHFYNNNYRIEKLEFADGTVVETLTLGISVDMSDSLSGQTITGTSLVDTLEGSRLNDTINGNNSDDQLIGNKGNDKLNGGNGNDTYVWNLGDDFDTITETSGTDKIKFGTGISLENLSLVRNGNHLDIYVNNDRSQGIRVYNHFSNNDYRLEQIEFSDGSLQNISDISYGWEETDQKDIITGTGNSETFQGKQGNDTINGSSGNDTYIWNLGDGLDTITDNSGTDKIKFGTSIALSNLSFDQSGNDLHIIVNNDYTQGLIIKDFYANNNYKIETIEFADETTFSLTDETLTLAGINKTLTGTFDDEELIGGIGNDIISTGDGYNDVTGGKGNDIITGGYDRDTYYYNLGDGYDVIKDYAGRDQIIFGEGISKDNLTFHKSGDDLQILINGDDTQGIEITDFFADNTYQIETVKFADNSTLRLTTGLTLSSKGTGEEISGTYENDTLIGDNGQNSLSGSAGDDILIGNKGNDTLDGGAENDTYIWNLGDGLDTITDGYGTNTVKFGENISFSDLSFKQNGNDLIVNVQGNHLQGIIISGYFSEDNTEAGYHPISIFEFSNGSQFDLRLNQVPLTYDDRNESIIGSTLDNIIDAQGGNDTITTYGGDDIINGNSGDDIISSGNGNDILTGGTGNDVINGGYGNDTYIWNQGDGFDTISDAEGSDTLKFGSGISYEDLSFHRDGSSLIILVNNDLSQGVNISDFYADSGNSVDILEFSDGSQFNLHQNIIPLIYDNNSETIEGTSFNDTIDAKGGNDVINTYDGNDTIYGGDGNDTINSGNGHDTITGGKGDDIINGGAENDTYIWNIGDGLDTITDHNGLDKIKFGQNISLSDLSFVKQGTNLHIIVGNDTNTREGLIISQYFETGYNIETLEFSDGSTVDLTQAALNISLSDDGEEITGTSLNDIITGGIGYDTINSGSGDDTISSGAGVDTISAGAGNDTINAGKGDDIVNGGTGNDTYIWNLGDGFDKITDTQGVDKISFGSGILLSDISFTAINSDLIINVKNMAGEGICIANYFTSEDNRIETLEFSDGTTFGLTSNPLTLNGTEGNYTINGTMFNDTITGTSGNETINAGDGDDTILAGAGNDTINAGNGNDVITAGKGDDIIDGGYGDDTFIWNSGDGFDTITDLRGHNTIQFGAGISFSDLQFTMNGNNLLIFVNNDKSQGIQINDFLYESELYKIEYLKFNDGTEIYLPDLGLTLSSGSGNDTVTATYNDDTIYAGIGNDTINADDGDDILVGGKGNDTLNGGVGRDTYIYNIGDGRDIINETRGNDKIEFGTGISANDIKFRQSGSDLVIIVQNDENQTITVKNFYSGTNYQIETLQFADGSSFNLSTQGLTLQQTNADDTVNGTSYNDVIYGNGGHDTINAGEGNDTIIGGVGNDTLNGGTGNDIYQYNLGDGFDTISEIGGTDKIVFGEGITQNDLSFEQIGNSLKISVNGKDDKGIQINNQFSSSSYKVESIEFYDGSTLDISNADQLIQAINSFGADTSSTMDTLSNPTENISDMCNLAAGSDLIKKAI